MKFDYDDDEDILSDDDLKAANRKAELLKASDAYQKERKGLLEQKERGPFLEQAAKLVEDCRPFFILDWQAVVIELIEAKNPLVCFLMVFLKNEDILPDEPLKLNAYRQYREFVENKEQLKNLFDSYRLGQLLHCCCCDTKKEWKDLEPDGHAKEYYVLLLESASYVRPYNDAAKKLSILDVDASVVVTKGLEYHSDVDFDELFYIAL